MIEERKPTDQPQKPQTGLRQTDGIQTSPFDRFKSIELQVALFTSLLAFIGAIVGTLISGSIQQSQWKTNVRFEYQKAILQKRIDLIDKASAILNRTDSAKWYEIEMELHKEELGYKVKGAALQQGKPQSITQDTVSDKRDNFAGFKEAQLSLVTFNSEFAATMTMVRLYFGPRTRNAVDSLMKELKEANKWEFKPATGLKILEEMTNELDYGLDDLKLH